MYSGCKPNITTKHTNTLTASLDLEIPNTVWPHSPNRQRNKYFSELFNHTNLKITYRTNNCIEQNLKLKKKAQITSKYFASDIYKLICSDCGGVGRTGGNFSKTYTEHDWALMNNSISSKFTRELKDNIYIHQGLWRISYKCYTSRGKKRHISQCCWKILHT